ncbi:TetR/AcrR family transcriptional regulator [Herpetosiphon llansteffanensis]
MAEQELSNPSTQRRGRPREFDRTNALECAMRQFWQHGYETLSMADLTSCLGINPPSLYAAFGSKQAFFLEAIDHYLATRGAYVYAMPSNQGSPRVMLAQLLQRAAEAFSDAAYPAGCFVLASISATYDSYEIEQAIVERCQQHMCKINELVALGVQTGELPATTNAEELAQFFVCVLQGMSLQARLGASTSQLQAIVANALQLWPQAARLR